jgi:HAD superfamily hydrolase (TIGR01456 family)
MAYGTNCSYGFTNVVIPADILCAHPDIWPFSRHLIPYYERFSRPLPKPMFPAARLKDALKFDAIFVFNDPRDWSLDATIMADLLFSHHGYLGSHSAARTAHAASVELPQLYWSNPDVLWAAKHHQPRIGQGGFRAAFWGLLRAMNDASGGTPNRHWPETLYGKPNQVTMKYCEGKLMGLHRQAHEHASLSPTLERVYMVGDNPRSDIQGANLRTAESDKVKWAGLLVKTGVYSGEQLSGRLAPASVSPSVLQAVQWALGQEGWPEKHDATLQHDPFRTSEIKRASEALRHGLTRRMNTQEE